MRYLGNKEALTKNIEQLLKDKHLLGNRYTFFDAFCGTGTVADYFKNYFDIIINDNLVFATTYSKGRILAQKCKFSNLGFSPIDYFNTNSNVEIDFFSKNYSPKLSGRMYFTDFNAGRIDYFRNQIERWKIDKLINNEEYSYLLGCLLESVSKVANIAGVYGAYLKKWDPRAIKEIRFIPIESTDSINVPNVKAVYNSNINDIISNIECDILYLDPPYTKNKYSVQYHLIETLIRDDKPNLRGITGTRTFDNVSDNWSKVNKAEIEFAEVIKNTKAKHIILSYSSDGIMSKDFITSVLKRYGKDETFKLIEIPYKKYRNIKTFSTDNHYEYLFYVEKKLSSQIEYYCPLNYMGGKTNIIKYMMNELNDKNRFIDLMGGGFNVGINGRGFSEYYYNDTNTFVTSIIKMFKYENTLAILTKIDSIIKKYGLEKHNKNAYICFRNDYNIKYRYEKDSVIYLYTLVLFGFQQQLRFNSLHEFNNPVGESGYNGSVKEKIITFSSRLKEINVNFSSLDFECFEKIIDNDTLVYIDPPYLITLGSYNDGKRGFNGWSEEEENRLISFLERIKKRNCKIVMSNILDYKGKSNDILKAWIKKNDVKIKDIEIRGRKEIMIVYEATV